MNRPLAVVAGVVSIALALAMSAQIHGYAQTIHSAKISTPAKVTTAMSRQRPHRLAVQVDVNDPAIMNLASIT
jgi:hypothetical protein